MPSVLVSLLTFAVTACGSLTSVSEANGTAPAFSGNVHGGQQPVTGASVQFYAAGATGLAAGATSLLSTPIQTDSKGAFSVAPGQLTCPSASDFIYVVSSGGNPGFPSATNNSAAKLMTALGQCSSLTSAPFININELTTVAAVWPLAPYMAPGANVGADNAHQSGLATAFTNASDYINFGSDAVPGPALPSGWSFPVSKFYTLGDILSSCVNSTGGTAGDGSPCGYLFAYTQALTGVTVNNVLDAALAIANNPAKSVPQIFSLTPIAAPWQPGLSSAPADWTLPLTAPVSTPVISPGSGTFNGAQVVSISDSTGSAAIHYTTDGTVPTETSPVYSAPLSLSTSTTVQAMASLNGSTSAVASATFTALTSAATELAFASQPATAGAGATLTPTVTVVVEDASGNVVPNATNPVTLSLVPSASAAALHGTLTQTAVHGLANFGDLTVGNPGETYQLVATSPGLTPATSAVFSIVPASNGSSYSVPAPNACQSGYDLFYESEPGVYAYWPLCESSTFYDYVGIYPFSSGGGSAGNGGNFGAGPVKGGTSGPVADAETAASTSGTQLLAWQNFWLNKNAGTIALWFNGDGPTWAASVFNLVAQLSGQKSGLNLSVLDNGSLCFQAALLNTAGTAANAQACGYKPNVWHRAVMTWSSGMLTMYVDGAAKASTSYTGTLDNTVFFYTLFGYAPGKSQSLAKVMVANQAWSAAQVAADFAPTLATPPTGGVLVTSQQLGTIHRDVLGFADGNTTLDGGTNTSNLNSGLSTGGLTSARYAGGYSGITADGGDWQHGAAQCLQGGGTSPAMNSTTHDTLDNFMQEVAQPLGLSVGYTVNYGSNPPACNAGGDPVVNGANLVRYANLTKGYGIKRWEIGNEQYAYGGYVIDLHANPYLKDGSSQTTYHKYEPAFYNAMKAVDPTIQIGIPGGGPSASYNLIANFTLPVLSNAAYDALVVHPYAILNPIDDGSSIYPDRVASNLANQQGYLLTDATIMLNYGKDPTALWLTEWDDEVGGAMWSRQTLGAATPMFAAMQLARFMQQGVPWATWWYQGQDDYCDVYNYDGSAENSYNWTDGCGSSVLVISGAPPADTGGKKIGFKPGDITPVARAFQILSVSGFVTEGEHMLRTVTDLQGAPWLAAYGASHGGSYAVILVNRDRDAAHTIPVKLANQASGSTVTQWTYGRAQYDQTYFGNWSVGPVRSNLGAWNGTMSATLPPWSVNVLVFGN